MLILIISSIIFLIFSLICGYNAYEYATTYGRSENASELVMTNLVMGAWVFAGLAVAAAFAAATIEYKYVNIPTMEITEESITEE